MQTHSEDVQRWAEQMIWQPCDQRARGSIAEDHIPAAVDDDTRIRIMRVEQALQCGVDPNHGRGIERRLRITRGVSRGQQQRVALAQRHVEAIGQRQHQLGRGPGPSGLDEAEMAGDTPTSNARSIWLRRRRVRHSRTNGPTAVAGMERTYGASDRHTMTSEVMATRYLMGNRCRSLMGPESSEDTTAAHRCGPTRGAI